MCFGSTAGSPAGPGHREATIEDAAARLRLRLVEVEAVGPGQVHEPHRRTAVQPRIAEYLVDSSWRLGVAQYIRLLAGEADIRGVALDGADSPLVR